MFSTTQLDMLEPLVQAMYKEGYIYYVAHTNTNINSYSNYDFIDLELFFSKYPFTFTNYRFQNSYETLHFECITRNVSNNNSDSKLPRVSYSVNESVNISVPDYEHIYTNTSGTYFGDVIALQEYQYNNDIGFNLDLNYYTVIPILLSVLIIMKWFNLWFAKNVGDRK